MDKELVEGLLKECTKMEEFDHPNVLKLRGVCLDGGPAPYIIMPFMTNGSLQSYLKENRDSLVVDPVCDGVSGNILNSEAVYKYSLYLIQEWLWNRLAMHMQGCSYHGQVWQLPLQSFQLKLLFWLYS